MRCATMAVRVGAGVGVPAGSGAGVGVTAAGGPSALRSSRTSPPLVQTPVCAAGLPSMAKATTAPAPQRGTRME